MKPSKPYDPRIDYCGPQGAKLLVRVIPRKIAGVDINLCCYFHDQGWADGEGHTKADNQFRRDIQTQFNNAGKPRIGVAVSWLYFLAVRLGRLALRVRGVK